MISNLILELRLAFAFIFCLDCLKEPLVMVDLLGSDGMSMPISCLICLIRFSSSSFSGSQ